MSNFIVPIGSLPSITSLSELKPASSANASGAGSIPFADYLKTAIQEVASTTEASQNAVQSLAVGGTDDLHTGAIAAVKATTAISYTTNLVSKAISAYNEIIRMQI